jgi:hypothetical protein
MHKYKGLKENPLILKEKKRKSMNIKVQATYSPLHHDQTQTRKGKQRESESVKNKPQKIQD